MNDFKTFSLRIPTELSKRLKLYAVQNDISMQQLIINLIEKELEK